MGIIQSFLRFQMNLQNHYGTIKQSSFWNKNIFRVTYSCIHPKPKVKIRWGVLSDHKCQQAWSTQDASSQNKKQFQYKYCNSMHIYLCKPRWMEGDLIISEQMCIKLCCREDRNSGLLQLPLPKQFVAEFHQLFINLEKLE